MCVRAVFVFVFVEGMAPRASFIVPFRTRVSRMCGVVFLFLCFSGEQERSFDGGEAVWGWGVS